MDDWGWCVVDQLMHCDVALGTRRYTRELAQHMNFDANEFPVRRAKLVKLREERIRRVEKRLSLPAPTPKVEVR